MIKSDVYSKDELKNLLQATRLNPSERVMHLRSIKINKIIDSLELLSSDELIDIILCIGCLFPVDSEKEESL